MAKDSALITLAKARWQQASEADHAQRERELADLRFFNGEQWSKDQLESRAAQAGGAGPTGTPPVPARPSLVINKLKEPIRQVLNAERQADFTVEIAPADDFGLELAHDEIDLREGLVRRIQRQPEATDARTWAFDRAVKAGRGFYAVLTRYVPGKTWDKEVYVHRFYNQASVLLDPAHEQPDGSDAEWAFIGVDMSIDKYNAEYGKKNAKGKYTNRVSQAADTDSQWRALGDEAPDWFKTEGETKAVRVVDYLYTEYETKTLCQMADGSAQWKDELPDDLPDEAIVDERPVTEKTIKWCKLDGVQVLDETDWEGPDMPIVKVLGEEVQPYDTERRAEGMVRGSRDGQMGANSMVSKWVETIGLAPIPPLMVEEGTWEVYKAWYQLANTRALPVLPWKSTNLLGGEASRPDRPPSGAGELIQPLAMSVQMFNEAIQSTTGVPEARVGRDTAKRDQSGRALREQRESSEHGTSNFLDNLRRSMRYEGQIENNLLYPIYGTRAGRLARIIDGEGDPQTVVIGQPAQPLTAPQGQKPPKQYTLTKDAGLNVAVKVTPGQATRRDAEFNETGELIAANPEFMTWFGDLHFKNSDRPGAKQLAKRVKVMLAPPIQQMLAAEEQGQVPLPPEAQQAMAQLKAENEQLKQGLQQAQLEKQGKVVEGQQKAQIAAADRQADLVKTQMDNETKLAVAELGAKIDRLDLFLTERSRLGVQQHEAAMATAGRAHEAGMAAAGASQSADAAEAERQHAAEMQRQQLTTPPPTQPETGA